MVLVQLCVHRVDLTLAEGVIQRVIDGRRSDAEARGRRSINHYRLRLTAQLLIGDHIGQLWELFQLSHEIVRDTVQFGLTGVFQRVLVFGSADAIVHRQVLHRLHIERDAGNLRYLRLQSLDHRGRRHLAILERLQIDLDSTAVEGSVRAVGSDEGRDPGDRRIV